MQNIYLSSTLRTDWNLKFNLQLTTALESKSIKVYLPQRDTDQSGGLALIFKQDLAGMKLADYMLVVVKNASPNLWTELGWAHGKGTPIILLADNADFIPAFPSKMATEIMVVPELENIKAYLSQLVLILNTPKKKPPKSV